MVQEAKAQMELGEQVLEAPELEALQDTRAEHQEGKKAFVKADKAAREKIKELEIGGIVRVGRYKITVSSTPSREVEFTAEAGQRISIKEEAHD